jgi:hypothetical protein
MSLLLSIVGKFLGDAYMTVKTKLKKLKRKK